MIYLIITLAIIYIISSTFTHRFQEMTKQISKNFGNGLPNANIQGKMTPSYVGLLVILNGTILIAIGGLLWYHFTWWYGIIAILILFFGIGFIEMFSPIPNRVNILKIMEKELNKNRLENFPIIHMINEIIEYNISKR